MVWDFSDFETKDLKKALKLYEKLEDIGFEVNSEEIEEIEAELENREENIEE